jgi:hypothetical protein
MRGRLILAAAAASLASIGIAAASDDTALGSVTNDFYAVYSSFHPSDGVPATNALTRYQPYLSPGLGRLLADAVAAEARFAGKYKDSPPLIEGDLFTSNFEGATSYSIRKCEAQGTAARCAVDLAYVPTDGKNKPITWTDRVYLVRTNAGWRVDDIGYGATWAFGNKGRLSETLKEAISDAGS